MSVNLFTACDLHMVASAAAVISDIAAYKQTAGKLQDQGRETMILFDCLFMFFVLNLILPD